MGTEAGTVTSHKRLRERDTWDGLSVSTSSRNHLSFRLRAVCLCDNGFPLF